MPRKWECCINCGRDTRSKTHLCKQCQLQPQEAVEDNEELDADDLPDMVEWLMDQDHNEDA